MKINYFTPLDNSLGTESLDAWCVLRTRLSLSVVRTACAIDKLHSLVHDILFLYKSCHQLLHNLNHSWYLACSYHLHASGCGNVNSLGGTYLWNDVKMIHVKEVKRKKQLFHIWKFLSRIQTDTTHYDFAVGSNLVIVRYTPSSTIFLA